MGLNLNQLEQEKGAIVGFDGDFSFLSNFHPSPIHPWWWPETLPAFPTVEHAFAASKVRCDGRELAWLEAVEKIRTAATPGQAKRLGRKAPLRETWERIDPGGEPGKVKVMRLLLAAKFSPGSELAQGLIDTFPRLLVEGNTWGDTFWGVTREAGGENWLGKLLMGRRTVLLDERWTR